MTIHIKNSQRSKSLNQRKIRRDLSCALSMLGLESAELSLFFVSDDKMKRLNAEYRGINKSTDVLSFPMFDMQTSLMTPDRLQILGDIVINVPQASRQADQFQVPVYEELLRLLLHGLLHLLGYDHEVGRLEALKMSRKEKEIFHSIKTMA